MLHRECVLVTDNLYNLLYKNVVMSSGYKICSHNIEFKKSFSTRLKPVKMACMNGLLHKS